MRIRAEGIEEGQVIGAAVLGSAQLTGNSKIQPPPFRAIETAHHREPSLAVAAPKNTVVRLGGFHRCES